MKNQVLVRAFAVAVLVLCMVSSIARAEEYELWKNIEQDGYAMRGVSWEMTADEVASVEEGSVLTKGNVRIEEPEIYKLKALRLTYLYEEGVMTARSFRLPKDEKIYGSIFFSLYMRYGVPLYTEKKGKTQWWYLDDVRIELCITDYVFVIYHRVMPEE